MKPGGVGKSTRNWLDENTYQKFLSHTRTHAEPIQDYLVWQRVHRQNFFLGENFDTCIAKVPTVDNPPFPAGMNMTPLFLRGSFMAGWPRA